MTTPADAEGEIPGSEPAIRCTGLTRRFGPVTAVDGVDLAIPRAAISGFLGPNGSGKTTTIRMLCGLLVPTRGEVEVLGLVMPREAQALRRRIGYMTQRFSLWEDLTVLENLDFMGRIQSLPRRRRAARIAAVLDEHDLGRFRHRRAGAMSGGERQRLALAAASLHEPDLLLLDEPTSAVDPESRRRFWASLFRLVDGGTTILVSTHYMDEAERCHRLAILDRGRLVREGTPAGLAAELEGRVVEVCADRVQRARDLLGRLPGVVSVAQLGMRLHVLLSPDAAPPPLLLDATLRDAGVEASVAEARPGLEDVFVAATAGPDAGRVEARP